MGSSLRCIYMPLRQGYVDIDTLKFYMLDVDMLSQMEDSDDKEFLNVEFRGKPCKEVSQSNDVIPFEAGRNTVYTYCLGYYSFDTYEYSTEDTYIRVISDILYVWYKGYIISYKLYDGLNTTMMTRYKRSYFDSIFKNEDDEIVIDTLLEHFVIGKGYARSDTLNGIGSLDSPRECPHFSKSALKRYVLLQ